MPEWALTDRGRSDITGFGAWVVGLGAKTSAIVRVLIPIATALGIGGALRGLHLSIEAVSVLAVAAYSILVLGLTAVWRRAQGAPSYVVVRHWERVIRDYESEVDRANSDSTKSILLAFGLTLPLVGLGVVVLAQRSLWGLAPLGIAIPYFFYLAAPGFIRVGQADIMRQDATEFSGNGASNIDTITVTKPSTIDWSCSGCAEFSIKSDASERPSIAVASDARKGKSAIGPGTYNDVQVTANGKWSFKIKPVR